MQEAAVGTFLAFMGKWACRGQRGQQRGKAGQKWAFPVPCGVMRLTAGETSQHEAAVGVVLHLGGQMGAGGRLMQPQGREMGKRGACMCWWAMRLAAVAWANGRLWPGSLIAWWLKCLHDKHKARKLGKKARECKSISKECTTFAMPKTK